MSRWTTPLLRPEDAIKRARGMTRFGKYVLGAGGFHPAHHDPQAPHWKHGRVGLDCSGFLFWCWGVSRTQRGADGIEHLNTDWLVQDARGERRRVELVDSPQPGDAVVFGGHRDRKGVRKVGHCGIVTGVTGGSGSIFAALRVIHCSSGNQRRFGYAIEETDGQVFNGGKDTVFVRPLP